MRTQDPTHMFTDERMAELGDILAAGLQRLAAQQVKQIDLRGDPTEQLDEQAESMAPCGPTTEAAT